jgi:hypothetical protein
MVLPDKVPVNVTTPTAPKLIVLPVRLPLMWRLSGGDDSMNVPSSALAVCVHVREQKPLNGPVHSPAHVPLRSTEGGAWVAVGVGGAGRTAPVAINDARPTTRTIAPSDSSVLYRLMPLPIIDARPSKSGNRSGRGREMESSMRCSRNVGDAKANGSSNRMAAQASMRQSPLWIAVIEAGELCVVKVELRVVSHPGQSEPPAPGERHIDDGRIDLPRAGVVWQRYRDRRARRANGTGADYQARAVAGQPHRPKNLVRGIFRVSGAKWESEEVSASDLRFRDHIGKVRGGTRR